MFGGVCNPDTSFVCRDCRLEFFPESMSDGYPGICEVCGGKRDAEIYAEKCADFRYVSKDWFQRIEMQTPIHELVDRDTEEYIERFHASVAFNRGYLFRLASHLWFVAPTLPNHRQLKWSA